MPLNFWRARKNLWMTRLAMVALDGAAVFIAYLGAYWFRFEGSMEYHRTLISATYLPCLALKLICFQIFGMYRGMWRYTSLRDLYNLTLANLAATCANLTWFFFIERAMTVYRSVVILDGMLTILGTSLVRLAVRLYYQNFPQEKEETVSQLTRIPKRLLVVGAGQSGEKVLREMRDNKHLCYEVVGFLDDDPHKHRRWIHGVPILGFLEDMERVIHAKAVDEILIAVPSATSKEMRRIVGACEHSGLSYRTLPGIGELIDGRVNISLIRNVSYEDLLGREVVRLDMEKISGSISGKRVLVTGAGGSIGSELCRQLSRFQPESLVLLDRTENNLYHVELEMRHHFPDLLVHAELADIQKGRKIAQIFKDHQCQVVFHAAAFKHVPLMELHPWEAINNNVRGTSNVLQAAVQAGVERFVLVSTDKAVRPTNIMGATKRVAELLTARQATGSMRCMTVRFGNVVGSEGSVIPLFKKQIEHGGPITITHPEVTRYFMTIPEASQLILQAGAMGDGGEIFILHMGEPIRILDLARDLIRLSGFEPDVDMEIKIIGLRPGEKLYEELITSGEGIISTEHEKIMVLRGTNYDPEILTSGLRELYRASLKRDASRIRECLRVLVPEYQLPTPSNHEKTIEKG